MIEAKNLTKIFDGSKALDSVDFTVGQGSVFGLVGSNGAGKSTFLRLLAGVYRPDGGTLLVDGAAPFENSAVKGRVLFISDYPYFFPQATLSEMAAFYRALYPRWNENKYAGLCGVFPIAQKRRLADMSKGMQRQAALVCALACQPDYLLLDEIFDGLDPVMRQILKRVLAGEVSGRGMSAVIASHNLRELEDVCDHVGLFHRGGVVFEQELDALKCGLCKVQAVFKPMPEPGTFPGLHILKSSVHGALLELLVRDPKEKVKAALEGRGALSVEAVPLTLEEVFISEMEVAGYDLENILG